MLEHMISCEQTLTAQLSPTQLTLPPPISSQQQTQVCVQAASAPRRKPIPTVLIWDLMMGEMYGNEGWSRQCNKALLPCIPLHRSAIDFFPAPSAVPALGARAAGSEHRDAASSVLSTRACQRALVGAQSNSTP